jgi:hypothetical protein
MKHSKISAGAFIFMLMLFVQPLFAQTATEIEIEIDVAPSVLNLSNSGTVVTVHTDIAYSAVEGATVTLNGIAIDWWKSDSRGYFVAKFDIDEVKGIVDPGTCLLKMEGETKSGELFWGEQQITVIAGKK